MLFDGQFLLFPNSQFNKNIQKSSDLFDQQQTNKSDVMTKVSSLQQSLSLLAV